MNGKILVIAAHPDDEVLGCGGTIAKSAAQGATVKVLVLGEGATSRFDDRHDADDRLTAELRDKSRQAAKILGVAEIEFASLPDNRFDSVPLLEIVKIIERVLESFKPDIIFTQSGGDLNIDHVITHRATMTAARPRRGTGVKSVHAYEVASSSEWAFGKFEPKFEPNLFVDISPTLELKLRAMEVYESESREYPHPRSTEALVAAAKNRGCAVGVQAAEAFQTVWEIRT